MDPDDVFVEREGGSRRCRVAIPCRVGPAPIERIMARMKGRYRGVGRCPTRPRTGGLLPQVRGAEYVNPLGLLRSDDLHLDMGRKHGQVRSAASPLEPSLVSRIGSRPRRAFVDLHVDGVSHSRARVTKALGNFVQVLRGAVTRLAPV